MSVFVGIVRYEEDTVGRTLKRITKSVLESAVKQLHRFKVVTEYGQMGVELPGKLGAAILQGGGTLSCQLSGDVNTDQLIDALRRLASEIPGAVVEDEEGNEY